MTFKNVNIEDIQVHPLFTVDEDSDDDEIKTVTAIHVARKENGKLMFAPRMRTAGELTSLEQIAQEFGGGEYVLIGYNNGRISARKTICLPGRSKPMFDEGVEQTPTPAQVAPVAAPDPMQAMMGGQGGGFMPFLMFMMQQQDKAADRQMQLMIAMMQGGRESSAEEKANARAEMQANLERERIASEKQMLMMREMMQLAQAGKGGGSGEDFTRGVEFMRSFATQQIETLRANAKGEGDSEWGSILETLGQVMQGVGMLKSVGSGLPEGVPGVSEVAEAAQ